MSIVIVNPFAGCQVLWTWAQHIEGGYAGGTDYRVRPPQQITAAADGVVKLVPGQNGFTRGPAIYLLLADGRSINYREVASPLVASGEKVKRGQPIGLPNATGRAPHIDATVGGVRVPFEPLVNSTTTAALDTEKLKEADMSGPTVFQMIDTAGADVSDWSRVGKDVLPVGTFPGGYEATADITVARLWINDAGQTPTGPIKLARTPYIAQQKFGAQEYAQHRADQIARTKEALGGGGAAPTDYATSADVKAVGDAVAAIKIPTEFTGTLG